MRTPIYVANEAIEMELGIRKISQLQLRSQVINTGKYELEENTLHGKLWETAK